MSQPAIIVDGISKKYRIGLKERPNQTFREAATGLLSAPLRFAQSWSQHTPSDAGDTFWALKDVSFEVQPGEVVGIIGRNGAGKSTLLKILSRITEPTSGEIRLRGRVASLLEVGTGFHPELTGRENIYLNGAILGMKRAEIARKFDEIVAFAEVEKFLDTPVKYYSSGMYVRLAFAVAAHLEPEILIVDEVLAVGDAEFQKKCLGKMKEVATGEGRSVLFVSHNMMAVSSLCNKGIVLGNGVQVFDGKSDEAITFYTNKPNRERTQRWSRANYANNRNLVIREIVSEILGAQPRQRLMVHAELESLGRHAPAFVAVDILDASGAWIMQAIPSAVPFLRSDRGSHSISVEIDLPPLIPGRYSIGLWAGSSFNTTLDDTVAALDLEINESPTPNRTVPHHHSRGYIVPTSRLVVSASTSE
jgi:lipopolysaccharide transport system ATP-binding protein